MFLIGFNDIESIINIALTNLLYRAMPKKPFPIACVLLAILMLFSACSHRVVRQEYNQTYDDSYVTKNCNPKFVYPSPELTLPDNFLGEVTLRDKGFSTNCSKADAFEILSEEACIKRRLNCNNR